MNRYPDNEWQEILGNCDVQLALGCTDELTATHLSSRTGEITIGVSSTAKVLSSWQVSNYTPQYRETSSVGRRKLMTMDEVMRMHVDKELVIIRGQKVLLLDKYDFTQHPDAKKLIRCRATDHVPQWASDESRLERGQSAGANNPGSTDATRSTGDPVPAPAPQPAKPGAADTPKKPAGRQKHRYRQVPEEEPPFRQTKLY